MVWHCRRSDYPLRFAAQSRHYPTRVVGKTVSHCSYSLIHYELLRLHWPRRRYPALFVLRFLAMTFIGAQEGEVHQRRHHHTDNHITTGLSAQLAAQEAPIGAGWSMALMRQPVPASPVWSRYSQDGVNNWHENERDKQHRIHMIGAPNRIGSLMLKKLGTTPFFRWCASEQRGCVTARTPAERRADTANQQVVIPKPLQIN